MMEETQKESLRSNHVRIINDLEPKGKILDSLYEDGILTENDIERIVSAPSRKERCQTLLSILPTRGPVAYGSFRKALKNGCYHHLADPLGNSSITNECNVSTKVKERSNEKDMHMAPSSSSSYNFCKECEIFYNKIKSTVSGETDSKFTRMITSHCCLLLDNVEPKDIVDQLYQDHVITSDQNELIKSGITRRKRCEILITELLKISAADSAEVLKLALNKKYRFINKIIADEFVSSSANNESNCADEFVSSSANNKSNCAGEFVSSSAINESNCADKLPKFHEFQEPVKCTTPPVVSISLDRLESDTLSKYDRTSAVGAIIAQPLQSSRKSHKRKIKTDFDTVGSKHIKPDSSLAVRTRLPACQSEQLSKRLCFAFNHLSTLINQGDYANFENISTCLRRRFSNNNDMMCIIGYLCACRYLFNTDFDSAKRHINSTMELIPKTSNPRYFTLELLTAKTRMYLSQKKLEKLQTTLDEALMILETDPISCTGRAAGWLHINCARNITTQLGCLNLSKPNALRVYDNLYERAKSSFKKAIENFKEDGGRDGPFGTGFALCRLAILLLRCGDNGLTITSLKPHSDDVTSAGQYLQQLENSDINLTNILNMHFCLAKCDYQFRLGNFVRTLEHAQMAYDLARELNMLEFKEHALNRLTFFRSRVPITDNSTDMSEEEVNRILFESSDTDV